jgi:hypothetical protein
MIGFLFLLIVLVWVLALWGLAKLLTRKVRSVLIRLAVHAAVVLLGLIAPLADEFVGKAQFKELCRHKSEVHVAASDLVGRRVSFIADPVDQPVPGLAVGVLHTRASYRDSESGKELASSDRYVASGGWLIRTLSGDRNIVPLTFSSTCDGGRDLLKYNLKF